MGKTTVARALAGALGEAYEVFYLPEPMRYWRGAGENDLVSRVYDTQRRVDRGEINAREAADIIVGTQLLMSTPYVTLDRVIAPHLGDEIGHNDATPPGLVLIFDRHPIAALLCYPVARYLVGCLSIDAVIALIALMPPIAPGTNLVMGAVPEETHLARLAGRGRRGESTDVRMLLAIRRTYDLLLNTVRYLRCGGRWREDARKGAERATLFDLIRRAEPARACAEPRGWALDLLADRLRRLHVFVINYGAPPESCVDQIARLVPAMVQTTTPEPSARRAVVDAAAAFVRDMPECE
ncbi:thymidine kinase [Leporid alphaherpesvirus 4]|uniref:Thymidine kinase n=1 Tax=Leporid alphaherpesvirus 4 TaxID=481315 RepID=J9QVC8_9ALPH|nr:thymidine kinase [Leporid alphaherpesvirus 4]AFR32465.1 thymidine kinase [Leporid alphaherpesvirus 4]